MLRGFIRKFFGKSLRWVVEEAVEKAINDYLQSKWEKNEEVGVLSLPYTFASLLPTINQHKLEAENTVEVFESDYDTIQFLWLK